MGGGGKGGTSTSTVSIPPEVLARYNAVNARAEEVAATPFQSYSTDPNAFVAPLSNTQVAGINNTTTKTPVAPKLPTTSKTPVGSQKPIINKSSNVTEPGLFSLNGQSLKIVPDSTKQHQPLHINVDQKSLPAMYHGSPANIKPGDTIKTGGKYSKDDAYATSDPRTAQVYARGRNIINGDKGQGTLWSVVHKVEPVPGVPVYKDGSSHGDKTSAYVSKQFKVVEPTHLIDNATGNATRVTKSTSPAQAGGTTGPLSYNPRVKHDSTWQPNLPGLSLDDVDEDSVKIKG